MWPVALDVDTSLLRLAPCDFAEGSPVTLLEAQYVRDNAGACGVRVAYCLADGTTNYAWEPHLQLEPVDIPLRGPIAHNAPAEFSAQTFELGENGIAIDIAFTADEHRLAWRARQPRPWSGFDIMAPPAAAIAEPTSLFFPYMREFSFVRQPLDFEASFNGIPLIPQKLPFLWGGRRAVSFKAARGSLAVDLMPDGADCTRGDDPGAVVDSHGRLHAVRRTDGPLPVEIRFTPPFPAVSQLPSRGSRTIAWSLTVGEDHVMNGTVMLSPGNTGTDMTWSVDESWSGVKQRGAAWVLTRLIPFLTRWPRHYSWSGAVHADGSVTGSWINAKPKT